jgi:processive 1,2-diacylglycerol beta-glucosyltransferase
MLRGMDNIAKDENVQLLIITGKLTEFRKQLQKKYSTNPTVATLGFVENMQDYLNAADIVVTKPGPATILEIELFQKQAILTRKVGIQEIGNIHYALQNPNFRYINDHWDKLSQTVNELLASPYKEFPARRNFNEATKIVELF